MVLSLSVLFQFTPPRGGRPRTGGWHPACRDFNSRPRVGGDPIPRWSAATTLFQFTPPRGGRPPELVRGMMNFVFQFTPPRGGRPARLANLGLTPQFQFTPPRGGRQKNPLISYEKASISIHAPAWGATSRRHRRGAGQGPISIHAPAWGATGYAFEERAV